MHTAVFLDDEDVRIDGGDYHLTCDVDYNVTTDSEIEVVSIDNLLVEERLKDGKSKSGQQFYKFIELDSDQVASLYDKIENAVMLIGYEKINIHEVFQDHAIGGF